MEEEVQKDNREKIIFLSSSFVNLGYLFALNYKEFDIFLVIDRKFPVDFDEDLDNFYTFTFDKNKIFEKDKEKYFDQLAVFLDKFEPDYIITNNYSKILLKSFIDFMKFRNSQVKIINIHHADLRVLDENGDIKYKGLNQDIKEMQEKERIITTLHMIKDEGMDNGKQIAYSHPTELKELKQKGIINKKEDLINYRIRNVVISYHERTKVLKLLHKILEEINQIEEI